MQHDNNKGDTDQTTRALDGAVHAQHRTGDRHDDNLSGSHTDQHITEPATVNADVVHAQEKLTTSLHDHHADHITS